MADNPFSAFDAAATIIFRLRLRGADCQSIRADVLRVCAEITHYRHGARAYYGTVILCDGEYVIIGSQNVRLTESDKIELMQKVLEIG